MSLLKKLIKYKLKKNACNIVISNYEKIKECYKKQTENKEKIQHFIINAKKKKLKIK